MTETSESRSAGLADDIWWVVVAVLVAAVTWLGAHGHLPMLPDPGRVGLLLLAPALAGALLRRHTALAGLILLLVASVLTERAVDGLAGPQDSRPVEAPVTLLSDPGPTRGGGVRAEARLDGRRVTLVAHRSPAAALRNRLAGEIILVRGELNPPTESDRWALHRHLSGRLQVEVVTGWQPGHGTTRIANGLRRTLADGATSLSDRHQSLLSGLLLGDSRNHPPDLSSAFRESGLAHLLVVSGANVVLLLTILAPVLDRMRLAPRLVTTLAALAFFALLTRGEPSVLRACAMGAVGAAASATGRPTSGLRRLALAVTGLLLVDPLLVTSLGFQLSTLGAAGIVVGARPLAGRLPGPRSLALPLAVTITSELAVAPLLAATFGTVPVVSVVANLLAGPVAGAVKVWGLTVGLLAGVAGPPLAGWLHHPTRAMLWWLDEVASVTAGLPVGELTLPHLAALTAGIGLMAAGGRTTRLGPRLVLRTGGCSVAVASLVTALLAVGPGPGPEPGLNELGPGVELWASSDSTVLIIDGRADEPGLLADLERLGVARVDLLILRTPANRTVATAVALVDRWPDLPVIAPSGVTEVPGVSGRSDGTAERVPGAWTPPPGTTLQLPGLLVTIDHDTPNLTPTVQNLVGGPQAPEARPAWQG